MYSLEERRQKSSIHSPAKFRLLGSKIPLLEVTNRSRPKSWKSQGPVMDLLRGSSASQVVKMSSRGRLFYKEGKQGKMILTDAAGSQARRYNSTFNWNESRGDYHVEILIANQRFHSTSLGLNTAKARALCQAKRWVMDSNRQNQNVRAEAAADGTPAQPRAPVQHARC